MNNNGDNGAHAKSTRGRNEWRYLISCLLVLDAMGILLAVALAYLTRFEWQIISQAEPADPQAYFRWAMILTPIWIGLFAAHRLYDARVLLGGAAEYGLLVNAVTYGVVAIIILAFLGREHGSISRAWLALLWFYSIFTLGLLRFSARHVAHSLRRKGFFVTRAIVAGADEQGIILASHLSPAEITGVKILGFVHDYLAPGSLVGQGFSVLGEPTNLDEIARRHNAEMVIVVPGALSWESLQSVMQLAADGKATFKCRLLPGLYDVVASGVSVDGRGPVPLLSLNRVRIMGIDRILKGALDYCGAALLIAATLPLLLLMAFLSLRKTGRLVEGHECIGVRGRSFRAKEFSGWQPETRDKSNAFHRYFYSRRLYRLPRLFNVLRGDMSLVGPRSLDRDGLASQHGWRHSLLSVKPGLTGPWLLAGRERLTPEETLRLDLHYVRNYSIWLDLQILFRTAKLMVQGIEPPSKKNVAAASTSSPTTAKV